MKSSESFPMHKTLYGIYPPQVFFLDWYRGLYEVDKKIFWWMAFMAAVMFSGIPIVVIYNDFAGYALGGIFLHHHNK